MAQPVLLIGGPCDGERRMLPDQRPYIEFAERPDFKPMPSPGLALELDARRHQYRRVTLSTSSTLSIFVHDSLSVHEALGRLVDRYPGPS